MTVNRTPPHFDTVGEYNSAYPHQVMPTDASERNGLRSYHAAMTGLDDDVFRTGMSLTIGFLPGGAPTPDEPDRQGTVVATYWGRPPILVLAESVSLRDAWSVILSRWPIRLSDAQGALAALPAPAQT
jgi:hypothetical protein